VSDPIIDLHSHTRASDGSDTPGELIAQAVSAGVTTLAITDHDTTSGWAEAVEAAKGAPLSLIPGIELSTQVIDHTTGFVPQSIHLLGYLVDPEHPQLVEEMAKIRSHRDHRLQMMVEKLSADYDISWLDVRATIPEGATPGRPHIAEVLIAKGIVRDTTEAFDHILSADGPYHVPHYAPKLDHSLAIIREAGGVPILAHPLSRGDNLATGVSGSLEDVLARYRRWVELGLMGVEIDHRENAPESREVLAVVADTLGLIVTGSSDYHGSKKPNLLGENQTTMEQLERILDAGVGVEPVPMR
jgi:predicted metal-dependent phosphoesterase TrpH